MKYKEVELKNGLKKYYFLQPKRCYCNKSRPGTEQQLLPDGTICRWCATITEKIAKKEDTMEIRVMGKNITQYRNKGGKVKKCKLNRENLYY